MQGSDKPHFVDADELVIAIIGDSASCDDGFIETGFKVYPDGPMAEIATAETLPKDVGVLQRISEEMVVGGLEKLLDSEDAKEKGVVNFLLPLRVSGQHKSSGFHENYERQSNDRFLDSEKDFLNLFASSLGSWTGQGLVYWDGTFLTTQKVRTHNAGSSNHVVAIIDDEDEGYLESPRYEFRRNNYPTTPWQLQYRAPYISAVIRAMEMRELKVRIPHITEKQHYIAQDTAVNPFDVSDSLNGISPIDWQSDIAERVMELAKKQGFPDYETKAVEEVARVLELLKNGKLEDVAMQIPWVFKQLKIKRSIPEYFEKASLNFDDVIQAQRICIAIDSKGRGGAIDKLRSSSEIYTQEEITRALNDRTHRLPIALERGAAIKQTVAQSRTCPPNRGFTAEWMSSKLTPL